MLQGSAVCVKRWMGIQDPDGSGVELQWEQCHSLWSMGLTTLCAIALQVVCKLNYLKVLQYLIIVRSSLNYGSTYPTQTTTKRKSLLWPASLVEKVAHFPSAFNQIGKILHRSVIPFYNPETSPKKTTLVVYSDKSIFWTFWTLKLTNFETRFWTRDTCHVGSEGTMW